MARPLTPKSDFIAQEKVVSEFQDEVLSPLMVNAMKVALLQYAMELKLDNAMDALKLAGAKRYIEILRGLGEPEKRRALTELEMLEPT